MILPPFFFFARGPVPQKHSRRKRKDHAFPSKKKKQPSRQNETVPAEKYRPYTSRNIGDTVPSRPEIPALPSLPVEKYRYYHPLSSRNNIIPPQTAVNDELQATIRSHHPSKQLYNHPVLLPRPVENKTTLSTQIYQLRAVTGQQIGG